MLEVQNTWLQLVLMLYIMINLKLITLNKEEEYERRTLRNFADHRSKSDVATGTKLPRQYSRSY